MIGISFPPGIAETLNRREIDIVYGGFNPEVHALVSRLLGLNLDTDSIWQHHSILDTPVLAIQSLTTHIGRSLPIVEFDEVGRMREGEKNTRIITPRDVFEIVEGPQAADPSGFISILRRAA